MFYSVLFFTFNRSKDILPQTIPNAPPTDYVFRDDLGGNSQDIYDFHDDSDRDEDCFNFTIDESPQKKPKKAGVKVRAAGKYTFILFLMTRFI